MRENLGKKLAYRWRNVKSKLVEVVSVREAICIICPSVKIACSMFFAFKNSKCSHMSTEN
jgi:hypothetical protein